MTQKSISISTKYLRWLLPVGLLCFLVIGFLQTPEVQIRLNPDFLWKDQLYRVRHEEGKADHKLKQQAAILAGLKPGERPGERQLRQLKKSINSVTTSLYFIDAMLANLTKELQAGLPQAAPARRAQLLDYLQKVKTLQLHSQEYHRRLQESSQKVHHF